MPRRVPIAEATLAGLFEQQAAKTPDHVGAGLRRPHTDLRAAGRVRQSTGMEPDRRWDRA